jgi:hypothetical protein
VFCNSADKVWYIAVFCNSAEKGLYFVTVQRMFGTCNSADKILYSAKVQRRACVLYSATVQRRCIEGYVFCNSSEKILNFSTVHSRFCILLGIKRAPGSAAWYCFREQEIRKRRHGIQRQIDT